MSLKTLDHQTQEDETRIKSFNLTVVTKEMERYV